MTFSAPDKVRLEIEQDPAPGALTNLVQNSSGEQGGFGWVTPVAGSVLIGTKDGYTGYKQALKYTTAANAGGNYFQSEPFEVVAGEYAAAFWRVEYTPGGNHRGRIEWLNASLTQIGQTAWASFTTNPRDCNLPAALAPASTAYARIKFEVANTSDTYPHTTAGQHFSVRQVTVAKAATAGALGETRINLALNPSLETNTTGWTPYVASNMSVARSSAQAFTGSWSLLVTRTAVTANYSNSALYTMSLSPGGPGKSYTFSAYVRAGNAVQNNAQIGVNFVTPSGSNWVYGGTPITTSTSTWQRMSMTAVAPSDTTSVEIRVIVGDDQTVGRTAYIDGLLVSQSATLYDYFDGSTAAAGGWTYTWSGTAHASTSVATNSNLGYITPVPYINILGDAHEIAWTREELNVGTLSATIVNPALDPAVADTLRPGRKFRLSAYNPESTEFEPLIQGRLSNAKVDYYPLNDAGKTAKITLTGLDDVPLLANAQRPQSVATIDELPYVLEGCGVPWNCNGSGNQVATATVIVSNDNTSALDQVALTRDTQLGYAWLDRWGVLQAWTSLVQAPTEQVTNGAFTTDVTGWTPSLLNSVAWETGTAKITSTSTTANIRSISQGVGSGVEHVSVEPGQKIVLSAKVRSATTVRTPFVRVYYYDVTGTAVGDPNGVTFTGTGSTSFVTVTGESTVPVGAVGAGFSAGVLNVNVNGEIHYVDDVSAVLHPADPLLLDESVYNPNIVIDYDTDQCINSVSVLRQWTHPAEGPQATLYGPYTDNASIAEWGRHHVEINVAGTAAVSIPAYATSILTANATPQVRVRQVEIPITDEKLKYAFIDLYDLVNAVNADTAINTDLRVTSIRHEIVANPDRAQGDRWTVTLGFASDGGVATPTAQPPLKGQAAGIPMLDMQKNGSTVNIANATESLITGWTINTDVNMGTISGSSVVIEIPGTYLVTFTATFPANAGGGRRVVDIRTGSATGPILVRGGDVVTTTTVAIQAIHAVYLDAGTVICGTVYQTSGATLTLGGTAYLHHFTVYRIGD